MKVRVDDGMETSTGRVRYLFHPGRSVPLGAKPRNPAGNERGRPGADGGSAGRRLPELHQLDRQRHRPGRSGRRRRRRRCVLAARARSRPMAGGSSGAPGCFRDHPVDRVLDHQRNRRRELRGGSTPPARRRRAVRERRRKEPGRPPTSAFCRTGFAETREREEREQWLFRNY